MLDAWQPIETAPRDGREIVARGANGGMWIVEWRALHEQWQIKKLPGRDPVTYLLAVEWKP